jgi:hypothetical protein
MTRPTLAILVLCATTAGCEGVRGGTATLRYDAEYAHRVTHDVRPGGAVNTPIDGFADLGVSARGSAGGHDVSFLIGADIRFGATIPAGFAYAARLYPAGVRLHVYPLLLSLGAGIGVSDAIETRDAAFELPAEAGIELSLGSHARLILRTRLAWLPATTTRRDGAPDLPFADELHVDLALRLGPNDHEYDADYGAGYFLGVTLHEAESARFLGVAFGFQMDIDFER